MIHNTCASSGDRIIKDLELTNCGGVLLPKGASVATCPEVPALVKANETITTIVSETLTKGYGFINEAGVKKLIEAAQFISGEVGNSITTGADGGLVIHIPAQLPDDQVLSGDNSGTVSLTLTPTTDPVTGDTNYLIKADLKVASTAVSGGENMLKWSSSGFYVDKTPVATTTTTGTVTLNQIEALAKIVGQDEGVATSPTGVGVKTINFVGAGVTAEQTGSVLKVTVPGGGATDGTTFGTAVTNFDSPAPTDGNTFYRNTTTGELWKWDSDKWSAIADRAQVTKSSVVSAVGPVHTFVVPRSGSVVLNVRVHQAITYTGSGEFVGIRLTKNGSGLPGGSYEHPIPSPAFNNVRLNVTEILYVVAGDVLVCEWQANVGSALTAVSYKSTLQYLS